jgi:hypothetical protein
MPPGALGRARDLLALLSERGMLLDRFTAEETDR